jgi:tetratricopeptide (TPR) repeat protein
MMLATADLMLGRAEQAYQHAVRLVELAPFEPHAYLNLAKSLEMLDRDEDAIDQLRSLLEHACEPGGIAVGYYRMAFFQWKQGNLAAAQACYHYAMQMSPSSIPIVAMELAALHMENPDELPEELSQKEAEEALRESGIPVAPTKATQERFVECARASFDAEVFPVARSFAHTMGSFSTDDITVGIIRSIEDAPDRPIGL